MANRIDVPVSTLSNPQPLTVTLKFDTPKLFENEGKFGKFNSYSWGVTHEGEDTYLSASETLNNKIVETGASQGDEITIFRMGTGKETRWEVERVGGNVTLPAASAQAQPRPSASAPARASASFKNFEELSSAYGATLERALAIYLEAFNNPKTTDHATVQATSATLWISAKDAGFRFTDFFPSFADDDEFPSDEDFPGLTD